MPITLKKLNRGEGEKTIVIPFDDDALTIVYNRAKYTPKFERELQEKMSAGLPGAMLAGFLEGLIIKWDLHDIENSEENLLAYKKLESSLDHVPTMEELKQAGIKLVPVPINQDTLSDFISIEVLSKLVEEIAKDQRPNQKPSDFTSDT